MMSYEFTISPDFSPDHISNWFIFNTWLQKRLQIGIHLELYDDFALQREAIAAGKIDVIYANPFDAAMLVREQGFVPLVRPSGKSDEAIIAVNAASQAQCVEDLVPRLRIATTADPHVHVMCMIMLEPADLGKENVKFLNCSGYVPVAKALIQNKADAGFFLAEAYENLSGAVKKNMRVLICSEIQVIEHVLLIGPELTARRDEMLEILISMRNDKKGSDLLDSLGFKGWEPIAREDTEFMIDLMDTLVS